MRKWLARVLAPSPSGSGAALGKGEVPKTGDVLKGKYRIERVLGRGGMGIVLEAHHELLDQRVAVKVLFGEAAKDKESAARFLREARAAAKMQSEHVARVMDVDTLDNGLPFIVMEHLQGLDLGKLIETRGAQTVIDVADFILQALEAVAQAHARGIIHRDLKPSNLFLSQGPDGARIIKILDFGISKSVPQPGAQASGQLTGTSSVLGSPCYMSPEQVRSSRSVDARTDIWSLGVCLYELLSARMPFNGEDWGELFAAVLEQTPVPLRQNAPHVPEELEAVVTRCLQRDRLKRFQNVGELARALAPFASLAGSKSVERVEQMLARSEELSNPRVGGDFEAISSVTDLPKIVPSAPRIEPMAAAGIGETRVAPLDISPPAPPPIHATEPDHPGAFPYGDLSPTASTVGKKRRTLFGLSTSKRTGAMMALGAAAGLALFGVLYATCVHGKADSAAASAPSATPPVLPIAADEVAAPSALPPPPLDSSAAPAASAPKIPATGHPHSTSPPPKPPPPKPPPSPPQKPVPRPPVLDQR